MGSLTTPLAVPCKTKRPSRSLREFAVTSWAWTTRQSSLSTQSYSSQSSWPTQSLIRSFQAHTMSNSPTIQTCVLSNAISRVNQQKSQCFWSIKTLLWCQWQMPFSKRSPKTMKTYLTCTYAKIKTYSQTLSTLRTPTRNFLWSESLTGPNALK